MSNVRHTVKIKGGYKTYVYPRNSNYKKEWNKKYYGNRGKFPSRAWSDEEEKEIMYSRLSDRELEEKLQRSISAIQTRRNLIRSDGRPWLEEDKIVEKASKLKYV